MLKSIPNSIGSLDNLNELVLDNNQIKQLPDQLCNLYNLEGLSTSFGMPSGHSLLAMCTAVFWSLYIIDNFSEPVLEDDGSEDGIDDNWEGFSLSASGCTDPSNDGED